MVLRKERERTTCYIDGIELLHDGACFRKTIFRHLLGYLHLREKKKKIKMTDLIYYNEIRKKEQKKC